MEQKRLLRPDEVAEIFDVTIRTVYEWIAKGRLPYTRTPGGRIVIATIDLTQFLDHTINKQHKLQ